MLFTNSWRPFAATALCCMSALTWAEDRLDTLTVIITANEETELPIAVSEVEHGNQPAANLQSLQDFLDPVPGLFTQNQDNTAQGLRPSIRGFGSRAAFGVRGIRVSMDGVPLTLPDGQTDLDALDLGLLDAITVVRGPSASLFGNAAGGALLLRNRRPDEVSRVRLDMQSGSFGNQRYRIEGNHAFGERQVLASISEADVDAPRNHAHTDTRLMNAIMEQPLATGRLNIWASTLDITSQDPGGLTADEVRQSRRMARDRNIQFNAGESIDQQRMAAAWEGNLKNWWLESTAYAGKRDFSNRLPFTNGGQVQFDRSMGGIGSTLSRQFELGQLNHNLSVGMDIQSQQDDRQRFNNNDGARGARTLDQDEEALGIGLLIRDSIALNSNWSTSIGLRYDQLDLEIDDRFLADGNDSGSRDLDNLSADISLSRYFDQHMAYARISTSFETPTFTELANPNGGGFNPDLESTEALNHEIGLKGNWLAVEYAVALYQIDVEDEITPFELATQPGRTFYRNSGKTERRGVEISADYMINQLWTLSSSLALSRNQFSNGNRLPGIPDETLWLAVQHRQGAWQGSLMTQYIGDLYADDANTEKVDGYPLMHFQAAYRLHRYWNLQLGVDNLLDKDYNDNIRINAFGGRYYEPAGGRAYRLSVTMEYS